VSWDLVLFTCILASLLVLFLGFLFDFKLVLMTSALIVSLHSRKAILQSPSLEIQFSTPLGFTCC
jgi:hypothetical protein